MTPTTENENTALIQLRLPPEDRLEFRLKVMKDGETMSSALRRLVRLHAAGQLPGAEPASES